MKWFIYALLIALYISVTFFGLGPVLFADGSTGERITTLLIVLMIYIVLTLVLIKYKKKRNK